MNKVVVVGAGLAGMYVARSLARQGISVTLLESTDRAGGKAGADLESGVWREHGYHIFPAWYANTRELLGELGISLIDFKKWFYMKPGGEPLAMEVPSSLRTALSSLTNGYLPWYDSLLYFYFVMDTLAQPLSNARILDKVSRLALMRERWYITPAVVKIEEENILKASAIPVYELSAMTAKKIAALWVRSPLPFLSILRGDLQTKFIEPFMASVLAAGVTVRYGIKVKKLEAAGARVAAVQCETSSGPERIEADAFVVTTPLEVTRKIIGGDIQAIDPALGHFEHLEAAPMAALHLSLKTLRTDLPKEHVFLKGGRYGLSFIDLTPHWGLAKTSISFISSNFIPLADLDATTQYDLLMGEIKEYLGITHADVESFSLKPNVTTPLFINTVGAWDHRPKAKAKHVDNLYFAGDWVRNKVDLACMEGAISSAIRTAREVGKRYALDLPKPKQAKTFDPLLMQAAKVALAPAVVPLWFASKLGNRLGLR